MMIREYLDRFLYHIEQPCDIPFINKRIRFKYVYTIILILLMLLVIIFSVKSSLDASRQEKIDKEFAIAEAMNKKEEQKEDSIEEPEETNLNDYENRDKIKEDNLNAVDLNKLTEEERKKRSAGLEDNDFIKNKNNEINDEEITNNSNRNQQELKKRYEEQTRAIEVNNNSDNNRIIPANYGNSDAYNAEYKENMEFKSRLDKLEKEVNNLGVDADKEKIESKQKELEDLTKEIKNQKEIIEKLGQSIESFKSKEQSYKMLVLSSKNILLLNDKDSYLVTKTDENIDLITYIKLVSDFLDDKIKQDQSKFKIEKIDESDCKDVIYKLDKAGVDLW